MSADRQNVRHSLQSLQQEVGVLVPVTCSFKTPKTSTAKHPAPVLCANACQKNCSKHA